MFSQFFFNFIQEKRDIRIFISILLFSALTAGIAFAAFAKSESEKSQNNSPKNLSLYESLAIGDSIYPSTQENNDDFLTFSGIALSRMPQITQKNSTPKITNSK